MSDGGSTDSASIESLRALIEELRSSFPAQAQTGAIVHLTPRQMALHQQCSDRTLERQRAIGNGPPYVKVGGSIRYPLPWFEKWLEERRQCSTSETAQPASRRRRKAHRAPSDLRAPAE
jgi:hypothetical protein